MERNAAVLLGPAEEPRPAAAGPAIDVPTAPPADESLPARPAAPQGGLVLGAIALIGIAAAAALAAAWLRRRGRPT